MGRPVTKWTPEAKQELNEKFLKYIEETEIPIFAEFAYKNSVNRDMLYTFDELKSTIKKCHEKKEAQLERLSLQNKINVTMAIFSLKQLGWKDKQEIEQSGEWSLTIKTIDENGKVIKSDGK